MGRPDYLFLIGAGRSGTTILRMSLGLHPSIEYNGLENHILLDLVRTAFENSSAERSYAMPLPQAPFDRIFERTVNELLWGDHHLTPDRLRMASFSPGPRIVDYLMQVFPNARLLHLVRNGIHVMASRQLFHAFQDVPFELNCTTWARTYELHEWGLTQGETYHLFRYEWLLDENRLRVELAKVFEWLELAWDDAPLKNMLSVRYHPTQHPREAQSVNPALEQVVPEGREKLEHTREERWKYWTPAERETFQKICGEAMAGYGYPIPWETEKPSSPANSSNLSLRRLLKFGNP